MSSIKRVEAWFASQNKTPFPFQRDAWTAHAERRSALIHTPTGTGKTLAAWLGPVMAAMDGPPPTPGLRVLWVTPLRALAGDTTSALTAAVDGLEVPWEVGMRTGDTPSHVRARYKRRPPHTLVTTPESLTVMLSYKDAARQLGRIDTVIVDEWHELMGSKRGVQLELALARLRRWNTELVTFGLSASLGNLEEAMDTLVGPDGDGVLIRSDITRPLDMETILPDPIDRFPWAGHLGLRLVPDVVAAIESARSTLVFTNTRSQTERWHQAIVEARPEWADRVGLHHGSLARKERQRVESALSLGELSAVVCTSSLDLGVDFQPVDQIVQIGSPKGIARLLQRAGRSGHRPGERSRLIGVPTNAFEIIEFAAARDEAMAGNVESRPAILAPLDVLVQHLVTIGAAETFDVEQLRQEVRSTRSYRDLDDDAFAWALQFVTTGGTALGAYPEYCRLREADDGYTVSSLALAKRHRLTIGTIVSDAMMDVRFMRGSRLGMVEESFLARLRPGDVFGFAGRSLTLVRIHGQTAYVRRSTVRPTKTPRWMGGRLPLSTHLSAAVLRVLADEANRSPERLALSPLLDIQRRWSRIPAPSSLLIELTESREGHHAFVYSFAGRAANEALAALVAHRLAAVTPRTFSLSASEYGVELLCAEPFAPDESGWRAALSPIDVEHDLGDALNLTELARRQFREIARIAGLVFSGYPGRQKTARQLQASSGLIYDVLVKYDPENKLIDQARRETLTVHMDIDRLINRLERAAGEPIHLVDTRRLTPLAFPLWADRQSVQLSTEKWTQRVARMVEQLERQADRTGKRATHARP